MWCVFIYAQYENGARSGAVKRLCLLNYTVTSSINVVRMLLLPLPYAMECNDLLKFLLDLRAFYYAGRRSIKSVVYRRFSIDGDCLQRGVLGLFGIRECRNRTAKIRRCGFERRCFDGGEMRGEPRTVVKVPDQFFFIILQPSRCLSYSSQW